ncbi:phospholipase C [Celerinatantimonas yamalensis]|uniref:Alkaline phosphatase family protein n=1 Tax=Celerinatantimonas yamalensis TaxID=559956 RepID=A0ABW9G400_9GAMM
MAAIKSVSRWSCALIVSAISWAHASTLPSVKTMTPIHHLVVVVLQDESFDRYFGIYPHAQNNMDEPPFKAIANTAKVAGFTPKLLKHNPNLSNPYRMAPGEPTCDLGYGVIAQKRAYNAGQNNMFIWQEDQGPTAINDDGCFPQSVMGYYDGNTLQALWGYAQHYAMADHLFATNYSTATTGQINLIAATTQGVEPKVLPGVSYTDQLLGNNPPLYDDASHGRFKVHFEGRNIGDLLNQRHLRWGAFVGGFSPNSKGEFKQRVLNQSGSLVAAYQPNDDPFQYFQRTANAHHLAPISAKLIGRSDRANHQYDLHWLWIALRQQHLPAVSFVFPNHAQNGHVGASSPLDEQRFLRHLMAHLKQSKQWQSSAVMLVWSNANGWYDHVTPPNAPQGMSGGGYGPRLPFLLISPWARHNYVAHQMLDQSSVLRFIEQNWQLGYLGTHTADHYAHSLLNMFNFKPKG